MIALKSLQNEIFRRVPFNPKLLSNSAAKALLNTNFNYYTGKQANCRELACFLIPYQLLHFIKVNY